MTSTFEEQRAIRLKREYMRTERQQERAIMFYSALGFVVGTSVGAFVAMAYVAAYMKEAVR